MISETHRRIIVYNALAVITYLIDYGKMVSIVKGHTKYVLFSAVVTSEEPILGFHD